MVGFEDSTHPAFLIPVRMTATKWNMFMRPRSLAIAGTVGLLGVVLLTTTGGSAPIVSPDHPISLKELDTRGIEGRLGFRLGTVLSASGHIVPNSSDAKADVDEPFFVRVENVNGKRIVPPVDYPARDFPLRDGVKPLKIGDAFTCTGYETGGYDDLVDDPTEPARAHPGYGFTVRFHMFKAK